MFGERPRAWLQLSQCLCCTTSLAGPPSSSGPQLDSEMNCLDLSELPRSTSAAMYPDCLISGGEDPMSGLARTVKGLAGNSVQTMS